MREFKIIGDYITLGQLLKVIGEVDSGGLVKAHLLSAPPLVNGTSETRRGRKLFAGDVVVFKKVGEVRLVS